MWPVILVCVSIGSFIGYWYASLVARNNNPQNQQTISELSDELTAAQQLVQQLQQENADLNNQLSEEKKACAYYKAKAGS